MNDPNTSSACRPPGSWRHRCALATVFLTLTLIFVGGLVTSKGAGLSVPDWPLSYGMLMPPMVGNVFYEHGHRMLASLVGLLTLILAVWTARAEPRGGVRRLAWAALLAVVAQGVLGGITVLYLLPAPVSIAHACLAQTFLCLVIALAYVTSPQWLNGPLASGGTAARNARSVALATTAVVFIQLLLGATMRHTGAGLAIPDFPLALGRLVPPFDAPGVALHYAHRLAALGVLGSVILLQRRCDAVDRQLGTLAFLDLLLVAVQIGLGASTVLTAKEPSLTTFHVAAGAAILGLTWFIALRAQRLAPPPNAPLS